MAFGGGNFDAGNDEEAIDGLAVLAHEARVEQVAAAVARVVIGEREAVQTLAAGRGDERLGAADAIAGKPGVAVEVDVVRHARRMEKIPSSKNQIPNKFQRGSFKFQARTFAA